MKKFLTAPRDPGYLKYPEYSHLKEHNIQMYMSSAWYQSHWSYEHVKSYWVNMLKGKSYFVCALPYQLSVKEGLLFKDDIEDEMSESTFDPITFSMEMEGLFYSDTSGSFFTYKDVSSARKLFGNALNPVEYYVNGKEKEIPNLVDDEIRILSVDVALLSSKNRDNDASALIITRNYPMNDNDYISQPVYLKTYEGLTTDDLGLEVMKTFYMFKCTHLVLDYNGVGMGVLDFIIKNQHDDERNVTYKALNVYNNEELAERCKVKDAPRVVWAIKGTASLNDQICHLLRSGIQNNRIELLGNEYGAEEYFIENVKGYKRMNHRDQALFKAPYLQTTMLVTELVNLQYEVRRDNVRIYEKSGMRKDRYSSLGYNYYVLNELIKDYRPNNKSNTDIISAFTSKIRKSKRNIRAI